MSQRQIPCLFDAAMIAEIEELRALEQRRRGPASARVALAEIIREAVDAGLPRVRRRVTGKAATHPRVGSA